MLFEELVDEYLDEKLVPVVGELIDIKRSSDETLYIPRHEKLNVWIYSSLDELETLVKSLPRTEKLPWEEYNELFLELVGFKA